MQNAKIRQNLNRTEFNFPRIRKSNLVTEHVCGDLNETDEGKNKEDSSEHFLSGRFSSKLIPFSLRKKVECRNLKNHTREIPGEKHEDILRSTKRQEDKTHGRYNNSSEINLKPLDEVLDTLVFRFLLILRMPLSMSPLLPRSPVLLSPGPFIIVKWPDFKTMFSILSTVWF